MLFGSSKSANAAHRLLVELGLSRSDVSAAGLQALESLAAEREALTRKLALAEQLADRDTLTSALNRRAFLRELHRTMSVVERYKTPAAVLYFDLDGFKTLNDTHGHAAGDAVLLQVARLLIDSVRESDVVGRLGGDEFGVILDRVSPEEGRAKALSLEQKINAAQIEHAGVVHRVRTSVGMHPVATIEDPEAAIARADEAMYAEKYARRQEAQRAFAAF